MRINNYGYSDINIGLTEGFCVEITKELQDQFLKLSGDYNPLHLDDEFAINKKFNSKVVYGMLIASFLSKLVGVYIPGEKCLLHSIDIKFVKPVYIGDIIKIQGTVVEKNDTFKQLKIKATVKNLEEHRVCKAIIKVGVLDE